MSGGVALIQGASRGLGLHFCKSLLRAGRRVVATCREPQAAAALQALEQQHPDTLTIMKLDVSSAAAIEQCGLQLQQRVTALDLLINCSAMLHPSGRGETSLKDVSAEGLSLALSTNTIGPLLVAKHFSPLLLKGSGAFGAQSPDQCKHSSILVNMSAKVASIGDNGLGGWYSYRMSKAALNMATRNLSIELGRGKNKVICVCLHPGTVDTDLSRPYHKNVPKDKLFSPELSVSHLMKLIDGLTLDKTGHFYSWNGGEIPW
ncbi:C-signal-like [Gastrophryne carolinensis]